jgi:aldose 1-epimerase
MRILTVTAAIVVSLSVSSAASADIAASDFGTTREGSPVRLFTITNKGGSSVSVMTYGATIVSVKMPDRDGKLADIVLGFDEFSGYQRNNPFFGATAGRYANRIGGAAFTLEGVQYKITANERGNTLHGGRRGFDKVVWTPKTIDDQTVEFTYLSKDGEEGFPGNLTVHVRDSLSDANEFKIEYSATTDKNTVVNLTNHSYFNLAGAGNGDVLNQEMTIFAGRYTPVNPQAIPTGAIADVAGTPFDFRQAHKIGERIAAKDAQLRGPNGYDENFVLDETAGLHPAARVYDPASGRVLELSTTEPGVQFYSANGLDGRITGKEGKTYPRYGAFCLEPQHFPDSPNHPDFPSTELKAGDTFHSVSVYKFSTLALGAEPTAASANATVTSSTPPGVDLTTGWTLLREGEARGTIEQDAKYPTNPSPHLLRIAVTRTAGPGDGRAGAVSGIQIPVTVGEWCDVTFSAMTDRGTVGLVFSLENADGKVLARTTLPEIGRGRGGRGRGRGQTTAPAGVPWNKYLVALHVRASDASAHMVITPIEPTNIWLDGLTLTPRAAGN